MPFVDVLVEKMPIIAFFLLMLIITCIVLPYIFNGSPSRAQDSPLFRLISISLIFINLGMMLLIVSLEFPKWNFIFYNKTESMKMGYYYNTFQAQPMKGDIVIFRGNDLHLDIANTRGYSSKPDELLQKRIGALEGETWSVDESTGRFTIASQDIGMAYKEDRLGRPLPEQYGDHIVPDGAFLPIGDHEKSFDGRYTGTVPVDNIVAIVRPVPFLTW